MIAEGGCLENRTSRLENRTDIGRTFRLRIQDELFDQVFGDTSIKGAKIIVTAEPFTGDARHFFFSSNFQFSINLSCGGDWCARGAATRKR